MTSTKIIDIDALKHYHSLLNDEWVGVINNIESKINDIVNTGVDGALTLRAYLFNASGTYTKSELEDLLSVSLELLVNTMKKGTPLTIFSSDDVSANISFVVESNYTLDILGNLKTLTLYWHQYQLWNTFTVTALSDGNYTCTIEQKQ